MKGGTPNVVKTIPPAAASVTVIPTRTSFLLGSTERRDHGSQVADMAAAQVMAGPWLMGGECLAWTSLGVMKAMRLRVSLVLPTETYAYIVNMISKLFRLMRSYSHTVSPGPTIYRGGTQTRLSGKGPLAST